jgi:hypothetical protein
MNATLATELETYEKNLDALIGVHQGKYVVIHKDRVLGAFDSQLDAMTWAYQQLGNVPFLVRQVTKLDEPLSFVSNLIEV